MSADGTTVVFMSAADDLGPNDTNGTADVYLRDLTTGTVTLVSTNAAGTDAGNADSSDAVVSSDGTKVAFRSRASDLGPADAGTDMDIYVRDLVANTTSLVSVNPAGTDGSQGDLRNLAISADGNRVVFETTANDLRPQDSPRGGLDFDVYVRDLVAGTTSLVSVNQTGTNSANFPSYMEDFSLDGTKVGFSSGATDLVPGSPGPLDFELYVRDLGANTTILVSITTSGTRLGSGHFALSPDGTKVVFDSGSDGAVPGDGPSADIFVRDLVAGTTTLVSVGTGGAPSNDYSYEGIFSPDSSQVAFMSKASNLAAADTNGTLDVYLRDLGVGTTTLVSAVAGTDATGGPQGAGSSYEPAFSSDGGRIAFTSTASNLGAKDSSRRDSELLNNEDDVYVRDLVTRSTTLVSTNAAGTDSADLFSVLPAFGRDRNEVVFMSYGSNLGPVDTNGPLTEDVYVATLHGADLAGELTASPEPVPSGDEVTYHLTVVNRGPETATVTAPAASTMTAIAGALSPVLDTAPHDNVARTDSTVS